MCYVGELVKHWSRQNLAGSLQCEEEEIDERVRQCSNFRSIDIRVNVAYDMY